MPGCIFNDVASRFFLTCERLQRIITKKLHKSSIYSNNPVILIILKRETCQMVNKVDPVLDTEAVPVIVGGMVLDINATTSLVANPRTTTPGKVAYALGGVARNVAECMSKLGAKPFMISAIGLDFAGSFLFNNWTSTGLPIKGIMRSEDIETAVTCNFFDGGELGVAVSSVESIETFLTPGWIQKFERNICSAPVLMVDANLSTSALLATCTMAAEHHTPLWFEPVSVTKSKRVASVVKYITYASPNEDELVAMANALCSQNKFSPIPRDSSLLIQSLFQKLKSPVEVLLDRGIQVVIVTLGPDGVLLCLGAMDGIKKREASATSFSKELYEAINISCPRNQILDALESKQRSYAAIHLPALSASVVSLTGAGDCLVGGTIASLHAGLDIMQSVAVGIAASKAAVETEINVPSRYELSRLADDAGRVYSKVKVAFLEPKL